LRGIVRRNEKKGAIALRCPKRKENIVTNAKRGGCSHFTRKVDAWPIIQHRDEKSSQNAGGRGPRPVREKRVDRGEGTEKEGNGGSRWEKVQRPTQSSTKGEEEELPLTREKTTVDPHRLRFSGRRGGTCSPEGVNYLPQNKSDPVLPPLISELVSSVLRKKERRSSKEAKLWVASKGHPEQAGLVDGFDFARGRKKKKEKRKNLEGFGWRWLDTTLRSLRSQGKGGGDGRDREKRVNLPRYLGGGSASTWGGSYLPFQKGPFPSPIHLRVTCKRREGGATSTARGEVLVGGLLCV